MALYYITSLPLMDIGTCHIHWVPCRAHGRLWDSTQHQSDIRPAYIPRVLSHTRTRTIPWRYRPARSCTVSGRHCSGTYTRAGPWWARESARGVGTWPLHPPGVSSAGSRSASRSDRRGRTACCLGTSCRPRPTDAPEGERWRLGLLQT